MRQKYGQRVQKITVRAGFSCPNRDGSKGDGGCTFCNNDTFAAPSKIAHLSITQQIDHGIKTAKRRYNTDKFIVYFQSYSNTYAPLPKLKSLYEEALAHPAVIGLSIGTRADCIDEDKLNYLESLATNADITLEYGIESIFDDTLSRINRGHDYQSVKNALQASSNRKIELCGHLILGFPWESTDQVRQSAKEISTLPIDSIKIHQLHIVKGTQMEHDYLAGKLQIPNMEEYQQLLVTFLEHFSPNITIQRLYGEAPPQMLVSPSWNSSTSQFTQEIEKILGKRESFQGRYHINTIPYLNNVKSNY